MTASCLTCRADLPDGARFCPACGAAVADDRPEATERKVVTTLFADLVGFTALGERHDPEDVDAALRGYYVLARTIIERFGGVVEKFIGDAVVGLFGVPAAHEDDAERAVRAALDIVARMGELPPVGGEPLRVRAAVNTGPALVRLHAVPGAGQGALVGDAVNTAARLLAEAAPMSVVVGERTHALSAHAIDYRSLGALKVRGKHDTVEAWLTTGPIARRGVDLTRAYSSPMVGREVEIGILKGMLARARSSSRPQLALVSGEAGVGKSRLIFDLAQWIDREPGLIVNWREGRCLPYGEGSGFQPLADVVRAHAGIAETDDESTAVAKLDRAVAGGPDHDWIVERLRPLVGLTARSAEQEENFRAWALFLDGVARERPTVVFFDDLHWADDGLLAFLDHIVQYDLGAPLLLLGACRPELFALHPDVPGYLGGATSGDAPVTRIDLASLSICETERLVGELSPGVSPDVRTVIVDRSGGNPFYAEELVRLLRTSDRNTPGEWLAFESLPDSLQALLTARLDALDADHKAVLADAAVAGQVFSPELVAALGDRTPEDVRRMLGELSAREFVRPSPDDSPDAAGRFAFWHALTRDAAYSQLPRGTRAEKHAAAARWLESRMGDGPDDSAEAIAHHYVAAVDLLIEMGDEVAAGALRDPAATALSRAGDAALPLDVRRARDYYSSALSSLRLDDELRPHLMVSMAEVAIRLGDLDEAVQRLRRGITELEAAGDRRAAAIAMTRLSNALYWRDLGGMNEARLLREQAMDLLKADGPTPELVTVLEERAVQCSRDLEPAPAIAFADEAIAMSESLGLPMPIRALAYRGAARCDNGAEEGVEDLEVARRLAVQQRSLLVADSATQLLADAVYPFAGPDAGLAIAREAFTDASQRREHLTETWFQMQIVQFHRLSGRWDEALDAAVPLEALLDARGSLSPLHDLRWDIAQIRLHRGDLRSAERLLDWCMGQFGFHPFPRLGDLGAWIALCSQLGDTVGAREALAEYEELGRGRRYSGPIAMTLAQVLRAAVAIDAVDLAQALVADFTRARPLERAAMLVLEGLILEKSGDLRDASGTLARAASMWGAFGDPFEEALALRDAGRCLVELGSMGDAVATLRRASEILARLDAKPALSEVNSLLAPIEGDAASHRSASSTGAPEGRR